jgi:transcriptional regulator with XRE-family HTH domain
MSGGYREIGQRLRAFRIQSAMSAGELAEKVNISRTALYRLEKGEVVKIESLARLADLLGISLASLLGVETQYIPSAVDYFNRLRQLEEDADRITILAGPISFLLASNAFRELVSDLLMESIADTGSRFEALSQDVEKILAILDERKRNYQKRRPAIINLISAFDVERLLRSGFVGRTLLSDSEISSRRESARAEIEHFARLIETEPMGVQIGLVRGPLPHTGFQIFRSAHRQNLSISPFRLGEQPNVQLGVAMITPTPEAVALHEEIVGQMWQGAIKGRDASTYLRKMIDAVDASRI